MMHRLFVRCLMMCGLIACGAGSALAALSVDFNAGSGVYMIESDAGDDIVVDCELVIRPESESTNGASDFFVSLNGEVAPVTVLCADVAAFVVNGGPGDNFVDFVDGLDPAEFTSLVTANITAGPGSDEIFSTFANDLNTWNPGDGSDTFDGRGGTDRQIVEGGDAAEDFTIGNGTGGFDVRFDRIDPAPFGIDIVNAELLLVRGNGGDDVIDASSLDAGRVSLELFGGDDDDAITGSAGDDFIVGGAGNDTLAGGPGADTILGGSGDDINIWNPGDGSDTFGGNPGNDRQIVNGGSGDDPFFIGPNDPDGEFFPEDAVDGFEVLFKRDPGFRIAMREVQALEVHGNDGEDTLDAEALPAGLIALQLFGGESDDTIIGSAGDDFIDGRPGNDVLIGFRGNDTVLGGPGDDAVIWNPGDGTDTNDGGEGRDRIIVNGGGDDDPFFIGPNDPDGDFFPGDAVEDFEVLFKRDPGFSIAIRNAQMLEVNGNGGGDTIDASALLVGLIALELFSGEGNDTVIGSAEDDFIDGGPGNDVLIGFRGNDIVLGGPGDDSMIWNPGDGSDVNDGREGADTTLVNGGGGDEVFGITTGNLFFDARFDRTTPGPFGIDIVNVENLHLIANDGLDTVTTQGLPGIAQFLDGGDPDSFPGDTLIVPDFDGDLSQTPVVSLPGADPIEHVNFEFEPAGVGALNLAPDPLDFGTVDVGEIAGPLELTLTNTGGAEVNVSAVSAPAAPFTEAGGSCGDTPFTLPEGASCALAYTFAPAEAGVANSAVTVTSDAGNGPQHSAVLSGTGNDDEEGEVPPPDPVAIPALSPRMLSLLALLLAAFALPAVRRMT